MTSYTIAWGHSGERGWDWRTAFEASRYAAETWGEVEAESPEEAVNVMATEAEMTVLDWYLEPDHPRIHVVGA